MISLEDREMNKLKEELEVLKSWGIENISVDKVLNMVKESEGGKDEIKIDVLFEGIPSTPTDLTPVGGTIFYIDDTAYGVYEFYDVHGNVIENVKVGDRPYAYKVISSGSKDKYYVYHDELYNYLTWTYAGDCEYDAYVAADTAACMYSGKTNTDRVMTRSHETCLIAIPNKSPTIWYQLKQMNDARVGGCNDWFIPSIFELEKLMLAVQSGNVTGGIVAGSSYVDSVFATKYIWSSTEASSYHGDYSAWMWNAGYQCMHDSPKNREFAMLIARAF